MSSNYVDLQDKNKEAAEQWNAKLAGIGSSLAFMDPHLFKRAVIIFAAYHNYFDKID